MNQFLETVKSRVEDAQKRLQTATQKLQAAQVEHQSAAAEFTSWQNAFQAELRREQGNAPAAPNPVQIAVVVQNRPQVVQQPQPEKSETNKTEIVRDLLRQHPAGIMPTDLWKAVSAQIAHRPYLYSILKRLKDKGDVFQRRGKYFPKMGPKSEEGKAEQPSLVQ